MRCSVVCKQLCFLDFFRSFFIKKKRTNENLKEESERCAQSATAGSDLHAYIAPALECNPSTFRRNTPLVPEENNPQYTSQPEKTKAIINSNIGITPNPNNGSFQITVSRNEKPVPIKEIKVYDIMGKVIWENGATTNNIFTIDITSYASGIYYVKCINEFDEMEMKKLIKQ